MSNCSWKIITWAEYGAKACCFVQNLRYNACLTHIVPLHVNGTKWGKNRSTLTQQTFTYETAKFGNKCDDSATFRMLPSVNNYLVRHYTGILCAFNFHRFFTCGLSDKLLTCNTKTGYWLKACSLSCRMELK